MHEKVWVLGIHDETCDSSNAPFGTCGFSVAGTVACTVGAVPPMAWSDAGLVDVLEVTERSTMRATALAAAKTSHWSRILIIQSGTCGKMATIIDVRTTELCLFATRLAMDPNGKVGGEDSKTGFQVALVPVKPVVFVVEAVYLNLLEPLEPLELQFCLRSVPV